ncbi:cell wall hydrolase, partial [Streptomyces angustmyceticus]|uniref:cell wall hydrolase n=1 Tax=Streptomyces angustmyceticus TaxID=285578 RepID=UPI001FC9C869
MTSDPGRQIPRPHGEAALRSLPEALRKVTYSGARHPGAPTPECPSYVPDGADGASRAAPDAFADLAGGANCQRYAYAVLRHFGLLIPPLRSAELWADDRATRRAARPRPLDLVLFDAGPADLPAQVQDLVGPEVHADMRAVPRRPPLGRPGVE